MNLFNRKTKTTAAAPSAPALIEVRSAYGVSSHIVDTTVGTDLLSTPALCGYTGWVETNTTIAVTAESVRRSLPNQHNGWRWCTKCVTVVLND